MMERLPEPFTKQQNFGSVQIESICRQQNKSNLKIEICFWEEKKTCGREKMLVTSIFSFFRNVYKRLRPKKGR